MAVAMPRGIIGMAVPGATPRIGDNTTGRVASVITRERTVQAFRSRTDVIVHRDKPKRDVANHHTVSTLKAAAIDTTNSATTSTVHPDWPSRYVADA